MRRQRYRSPERPRGLYIMQYLDKLIEENRAKRREVPGVADDAYWQKRREHEAMKDQPRKAA
jgi:hypothetical protein